MTVNKPFDPIGYGLIFILFSLLAYGGYLAYQSIDPTILQRLEASPLILPTLIPASPSAIINN